MASPEQLAQALLMDPFERAALRTRQATKPVGGREEGMSTAIIEALGGVPMNMAGNVKNMMDAAYSHPPGESVRDNTQYGGLVADTALNVVGLPALTGGVPAGAMGSAARGARAARPDALPMDEASRMARAKELGFSTEAYHGTSSSFPEFKRIDGGNLWGDGHYFTTHPETASRYATGDVNRVSPSGNADPNVMPVMLKAERPFDLDSKVSEKTWHTIRKGLMAEGVPDRDIRDARRHLVEAANLTRRRGAVPTNQDIVEAVAYEAGLNQETINRSLRAAGYDSIAARGGVAGDGGAGRQVMVFDPSQIRSRFAAFDPAKKDSGDLLAGLAGAAISPAALAEALARLQEQRQ